MRQLTRAEALRLLASVPFGRVVFTHQALPAIRPVNHIVDNGDVIIRSHMGAAIVGSTAGRGTVLAYEADDIDPVSKTGWSVVVTGLGVIVDDSGEVSRYGEVLHPWVGDDMSYVIRIDAEIVTGFEMSSVSALPDQPGLS